MTEPLFLLDGKRVMVAGHLGMAGGAILRRLRREPCDVLTADRGDLDMTRQSEVEDWLASTRPDALFLAAAKVGGIHANATRPAEFLYDNLAIESNIIHAAYRTGVKKLLFLGSSCIYPRAAAQPMKEEALLTGPLEPTNEAYAIAKIAGIKLCQAYRRQYGCDFISAMPTNLYGPGDRYDLLNGHVAAAMIMKIHAAKTAGDKSIVIWGSGTPRREFLFTKDLADGCVFMMKHYSDYSHLNLGTGVDITIRALAETVAKVAGWSGGFSYDASKPDGMPRKVMDVGRAAALGWRASTPFEAGMRQAYDWYVEHVARADRAGHPCPDGR
jgi:GDP-L-fucose synthase